MTGIGPQFVGITWAKFLATDVVPQGGLEGSTQQLPHPIVGAIAQAYPPAPSFGGPPLYTPPYNGWAYYVQQITKQGGLA